GLFLPCGSVFSHHILAVFGKDAFFGAVLAYSVPCHFCNSTVFYSHIYLFGKAVGIRSGSFRFISSVSKSDWFFGNTCSFFETLLSQIDKAADGDADAGNSVGFAGFICSEEIQGLVFNQSLGQSLGLFFPCGSVFSHHILAVFGKDTLFGAVLAYSIPVYRGDLAVL